MLPIQDMDITIVKLYMYFVYTINSHFLVEGFFLFICTVHEDSYWIIRITVLDIYDIEQFSVKAVSSTL